MTFDGPCIHAHAPHWQGASPVLGKGGGAKPPKVNKKMEAMQMQLMQAQLRQAGQKIEMPSLPATPDPAPPPPPPPSASSIDVQEASTDAKRQALKRSGYQATLFSGETGGYKGNTALGGQKTLLG